MHVTRKIPIICSNSSFCICPITIIHNTGELKWVLAPLTGLHPQEQRLLFRGKERDDADFLHIAGVSDMSKLSLVEDPASKEKKREELMQNENIAKACQAVALIRDEVDKLSAQIHSLESMVNSGKIIEEKRFTTLSELLMRELLNLDSIEAHGEAKVQRKIEVKRVQTLNDRVDSLKLQNSNPLRTNQAVVTTQWERFDSGFGSLSAPPPSKSSMTMDWEHFD
ncbi:hypothetical protein KP509_27G060400 [Ceratopteris richardii]|uniref:BAG family molecular chaperone regulator 4 n=1 Tax=Ceratopteris richardii TaxID=49495 RepID=A0A8T2RJD1_CERRI|nr:hypothetical protein KP509_27G060400 [Ceratopteris richardii]